MLGTESSDPFDCGEDNWGEEIFEEIDRLAGEYYQRRDARVGDSAGVGDIPAGEGDTAGGQAGDVAPIGQAIDMTVSRADNPREDEEVSSDDSDYEGGSSSCGSSAVSESSAREESESSHLNEEVAISSTLKRPVQQSSFTSSKHAKRCVVSQRSQLDSLDFDDAPLFDELDDGEYAKLVEEEEEFIASGQFDTVNRL